MRQEIDELNKSEKDAHQRPECHVQHENALLPGARDPAHDFVVLLTRGIDAGQKGIAI